MLNRLVRIIWISKTTHELYIVQCEKENKVPVKDKHNYKVFATKVNLHFKYQFKGTCNTHNPQQI